MSHSLIPMLMQRRNFTGDVIEPSSQLCTGPLPLWCPCAWVCVARTEALAVGEYYPPPSQEPGNETSISLGLIPRH